MLAVLRGEARTTQCISLKDSTVRVNLGQLTDAFLETVAANCPYRMFTLYQKAGDHRRDFNFSSGELTRCISEASRQVPQPSTLFCLFTLLPFWIFSCIIKRNMGLSLRVVYPRYCNFLFPIVLIISCSFPILLIISHCSLHVVSMIVLKFSCRPKRE